MEPETTVICREAIKALGEGRITEARAGLAMVLVLLGGYDALTDVGRILVAISAKDDFLNEVTD